MNLLFAPSGLMQFQITFLFVMTSWQDRFPLEYFWQNWSLSWCIQHMNQPLCNLCYLKNFRNFPYWFSICALATKFLRWRYRASWLMREVVNSGSWLAPCNRGVAPEYVVLGGELAYPHVSVQQWLLSNFFPGWLAPLADGMLRHKGQWQRGHPIQRGPL